MTLILTREFNISPEQLFAFVTRPDQVVGWWGPEGLRLPDHNLDFTRRAPWHSVMENDKGQQFTVSGEVRIVDVPRRVEFTWAWHDEAGTRGHESIVSIDIEPTDNGARLRLTHSDLPDAESETAHNEGWTSTLNKLEHQLT